MAVPYSTLLPPGLVLCLGLLVSTSTANYNGNCSVFKEILSLAGPVFKVDYDSYVGNRTYRVHLPVNENIRFVILKAVDKNNHPVGNWQNADKYCQDNSALYEVNTTSNTSFWAFWVSPMYTNMTPIKLQAFVVNLSGTATVSTLELKEGGSSTVSPSVTSTTRSPSSPARTSATVRVLPTTRTTTTPSSASRAFLSPITVAIQILLAFLAAKLLF